MGGGLLPFLGAPRMGAPVGSPPSLFVLRTGFRDRGRLIDLITVLTSSPLSSFLLSSAMCRLVSGDKLLSRPEACILRSSILLDRESLKSRLLLCPGPCFARSREASFCKDASDRCNKSISLGLPSLCFVHKGDDRSSKSMLPSEPSKVSSAKDFTASVFAFGLPLFFGRVASRLLRCVFFWVAVLSKDFFRAGFMDARLLLRLAPS